MDTEILLEIFERELCALSENAQYPEDYALRNSMERIVRNIKETMTAHNPHTDEH